MPDITMCTDEGCGQRELCYRYMAIPSEHRQSYFLGTVRLYETDDSCDYYMPVRGGDNLRKILVPGKRYLTVVP